MGLFNKLKNVLFAEDEVELPVIEKVSEKKEEKNTPVTPKRSDNTLPEFEETKKVPVLNDERPKESINNFRNVKRDIELDFDSRDEEKEEQLVKEENSPFLSFDEEEFEKLNASIRKEEDKKEEIRKEVVRVKKEPKEPKEEKKEPIEVPKRFRLSPVISPVYGILDKNYKKEDIAIKNDNLNLVEEVENSIDVDSVRRKAYGTLEDEIEDTMNIKIEPKVIKEETVEQSDNQIDEEIATFLGNNDASGVDDFEEINVDESNFEDDSFEETNSIEDELDNTLEVPVEEDVDDISDIDDVIDDLESVSADDLPSFQEVNEEIKEEETEEVETPNDILEKTNALKILDDIEKELDEVTTSKSESKEEKDKEALLEDTTETDLFNLIDSMYEDKEEK